MHSDDELDELLNEWKTDFSADSKLEKRALDRIHSMSAQSAAEFPPSWFSQIVGKPLYAGLAAAALIVFGIIVSQAWQYARKPSETQYIVLYKSAIDPLFRLTSTNESNPSQNQLLLSKDIPLETTMEWLQHELNLGRSQSDQFTHLHQSYQDSLHNVFTQLVTLDHDYQHIDELRKTNDVVDFLALYDLLQKQKSIRDQSNKITDELIRRASDILNTQQQELFDNLIQQSSPQPSNEVDNSPHA